MRLADDVLEDLPTVGVPATAVGLDGSATETDGLCSMSVAGQRIERIEGGPVEPRHLLSEDGVRDHDVATMR